MARTCVGRDRVVLGALLLAALAAGAGSFGPLGLAGRIGAAPGAPARAVAPSVSLSTDLRPAGGAPPPITAATRLEMPKTLDTPSTVTTDLADGDVYVTNFGAPQLGGNTLSVIGPSNNSTFATLPTGDDPIESIYDPADQDIYVLDYGVTDNLTVIHGLQSVASVPTGNAPRFAAYDAHSEEIYVSNSGSRNISVVNGTRIVATVPVGAVPADLCYDPGNGFIYVPNSGSNNLSILSGSSIVATLPMQLGPEQAIYDPNDGDVYVTESFSHNVTVLNGTSFVTNLTGGGLLPTFGVYDPATEAVYIADDGTASVDVYRGIRLVANVSVGMTPGLPAVDSVYHQVYVPNWGSDSVSVINGSTVVAEVATGANPDGAYTDPLNGEIDVPDFGSDDLSILGSPAPSWNVTAVETGLPSGTPWTFEWTSTAYHASGASVAFPSANGTYGWKVPALSGWEASVDRGSVTVSGAAVQVNVTFIETFPVQFNESGLTLGTNWSVTVAPVTAHSVGATLVLPEPNGTYTFQLPRVAGYTSAAGGSFNVSGAPQLVNVTYSGVPFPIRFEESGLPTGTDWTVDLAGNASASTGPAVTFDRSNGTYEFQITPVAGYSTPTRSGNVTVRGYGQIVPVPFNRTFSLTLRASGLPANVGWEVILGGTTEEQENDSPLVFDEPNGTYRYTVGSLSAAYAAVAPTGNVTIAGYPETLLLDFGPVPANATPYEVRFAEVGLPNATHWTVTFFGVTLPAVAPSDVAFWVGPGSFAYLCKAPGFAATLSSGSIAVGNSSENVTVAWEPIPATFYPVSVTGVGLGSVTHWSVTIENSTESRSGNGALAFRFPNGTYSYRLTVPDGYQIARSGTFAVSGSTQWVNLTFRPALFAVTFEETGLGAGTSWSVTLSGNGSTVANSSSGSTLTIWEANGSFDYVVAPVVGFSTTVPSSATVSVTGTTPAPISVTFVPTPASSTPSTTSELELGIGLVVLGAVAVLGALWRLRRSPPPSPEPTP